MDDVEAAAIARGRRLRPVKSLVRAIDLLDTLAAHPRGLGVSELAASAGFSKTATYNLVTTLETRGLIRRDGDNRYQLGWRILELGEVVHRHSRLGEVAQPHLERLAEEVGETALLAILDGDTLFCLELVESRRSVPSILAPGRRTPLHANASGILLLAYASPRRRRRYLQELPDGQPEDDIVARFEAIRRDGGAVSLQDPDAETASLARIVVDPTGDVIAAVSLTGPRGRLTEARIATLVPALARTAGGITAALRSR